jgi:ribosomal protein S18 acetylase RimI-like enzyme
MPSSEMLIAPATPEDAPALDRLINSAYRGEGAKQGWTTEADLLDGTRTDAALIEEVIRTPGNLILKCEEGGSIVGCVELREESTKLNLGMLTVAPDRQGHGIGKLLLRAAEHEARERKCNSIFMCVISVRHELIDWYLRHGYHDTGQRKPFAFTDPRFGLPKQQLEFAELEKEV